MAREVPEIDRLIEQGLTLYGQGDLDGAMVEWEKALAIDPDNAQAGSYVEYVRANYELLTADATAESTAEGVPFGIADDEPEYQIEIQPGEIKASSAELSAPLFMDPLDEGWFIDEETQNASRRGPPGIGLDGRPSQELTMELEAEEPPPPAPPLVPAPPVVPKQPIAPAPRAHTPSQQGMEFDDATREYDKKQQRPASEYGFAPQPTPPPAADEFGPDGTPGFGHPNDFQTPPGFGSQVTGIKQRDLGFVQPAKPMTATSLGLPDRPRAPAKASEPPAQATTTATSMDELSLDDPDMQTIQRPPLEESELEEMDLISSLPSPRPAPQIPKIEFDTPLSGATKHTTRDLPQQTRAPAIAQAKTKDLSPSDLLPALGSAQTQDFEAKTQERNRLDRTQDIPTMQQATQLPADNPVVSAPTRDLGLRENAPQMPVGPPRGVGEGTRADVMLAFDPIDARTSEIMEDVDETAPREETREDKTRRRITALFERAAQWSSEGDLERSVAAVDLALSEDPQSALAQKLIHRNRETIMTVFQAYLGDLQRTPQLARPLHELANAPISPRAAFLLSRIDGQITIDEILDVCGMPRLEAYRYLCQLFLRGILR